MKADGGLATRPKRSASRRLAAALALALYAGTCGCGMSGGPASHGSSTLNVVFASGQLAPPSELGLTQTASIAAIVDHDPGSQGVNWTVTCVPAAKEGANCGFITPHTASGYPAAYTAPAGSDFNSVPQGGTVTITAAAAADPAQSVTAKIKIALMPISVGYAIEPPAKMKTGATARVLAAVLYDILNQAGTRAGVDLTLTCGSPGACGSVSPAHSDGDPAGGGAVYTAPVAVSGVAPGTGVPLPLSDLVLPAQCTIAPGSGTIVPGVGTVVNAGTYIPGVGNVVPAAGSVIITATSTADPSKCSVAIVTVVQAPLTLSMLQPPVRNLPAGAATNMSAAVNFDPYEAGIDWSVFCESAECGTVSKRHTEDGEITTYTAPSTAPSGNIVVVTAASSTNPTKIATAFTLVTPVNVRNDLLNGRYAFLLTGVKARTAGALAGTLLADGTGNIISATETVLGDPATYTVSGNYFIGSDGHGLITLNGAPSGAGYWSLGQQLNNGLPVDTGQQNNGQQLFQLTMIDSAHALIEEFDGYYDAALHVPYGGTLRGTLERQTSLGFHAPSIGQYSFLWSGVDVNHHPGYYGGVFNGATYGFIMDRNLAGQVDALSGTATFVAPNAVGAGTATFGSYLLAYYVVDAGHFLLLGISNGEDAHDLPAGHLYLQGTGFATLTGSYAFTQAGSIPATDGALPLAAGGLLSCDAGGSLTGLLDTNRNGVLHSESVSGSCALAATSVGARRGTFTLAGETGRHYALYPTAANGLLLLQLDAQETGIGSALPQAADITSASVSGDYAFSMQRLGLLDSAGVGGWADLLGQITAGQSASLTGTVDVDQFNEKSRDFWTLMPSLALTGSLGAGSQGRFPGTLTTTPTGATQQIFYLVDSSTVLVLESDTTPATGRLQQQNLN